MGSDCSPAAFPIVGPRKTKAKAPGRERNRSRPRWASRSTMGSRLSWRSRLPMLTPGSVNVSQFLNYAYHDRSEFNYRNELDTQVRDRRVLTSEWMEGRAFSFSSLEGTMFSFVLLYFYNVAALYISFSNNSFSRDVFVSLIFSCKRSINIQFLRNRLL